MILTGETRSVIENNFLAFTQIFKTNMTTFYVDQSSCDRQLTVHISRRASRWRPGIFFRIKVRDNLIRKR